MRLDEVAITLPVLTWEQSSCPVCYTLAVLIMRVCVCVCALTEVTRQWAPLPQNPY